MTQKSHLIKSGREIVQINLDDVLVAHPDIYRPTGETIKMGGVPVAQFSEPTGKVNKNLISIARHYRMEATHDGVKAKLRKLRDEEAAGLDQFDQAIAEHQKHVAELKAARATFLSECWTRAHVVTVKELLDRIAAALAKKSKA